MTRQASFKRRVRARMTKTGESYAAARSHLLGEASGPEHPAAHDERMAAALHITNGDCTDLRGTGLAKRVLVWFDVLHEGPVPDLAPDEFRRIRAGFLGAADPVGGSEFALRRFIDRDQTLEANADGEYVLWFEADLYDQLQIVQVLARLAELGVAAERSTLICIGEYPGIDRFGGLGQLQAEQLRELPATWLGVHGRPCVRPIPAGSAARPPRARASCASSERRSIASAGSIPGRATGCR